MALTSWLDLMWKCKVKHVVCLLDDVELYGKHTGLGDGDFASTCRGQGYSFHHTPLHEGWPCAAAIADAIAALRRQPPSQDEAVAIICTDGRKISAAVAAAWLVLECKQDLVSACRA